jgi:alpha 1,2-mannosyltransferase
LGELEKEMKNCLIYSVKNDSVHLNNLKISLKLFRDNLNPFINNIDIIFFYDPGLKEHLQNLSNELGLTNNIILKEFVVSMPIYPEEIRNKINQVLNDASIHSSECIGYKNMCKFWAGEVFKDSVVQNYDYFLRLDCDSFILSPVKYDIFEKVENEKKICAYIKGSKAMDNPKMALGLNKEVYKFEQDYKGKIFDSITTIDEGCFYNTNFEICKIKDIIESDYLDLYEHIDKSGGIYIHRWGDHIIRYAGISIFFGKSSIKEFDDIRYAHWTQNNIIN